MSNKIEVSINISDYPDGWNLTPAIWECFVVDKLKDAGVPVVGKLVFNGISSGTLTRLDDPKDFGASIYVWES